jgi:hypothetical protein
MVSLGSLGKRLESLPTRHLLVMFVLGVILFAAAATGLNTIVNCPNKKTAVSTFQYIWNIGILFTGILVMALALYYAFRSERLKGYLQGRAAE